jgi:hypothetical protein
MKRKEKTPKQILSDENDDLCYWIIVATSKGIDAFDDEELKRPVAVHHLIHKTKPAMRWNLDDLFPMKQSNHVTVHFREEAWFIAKIIKERGMEWLDRLHLLAVGSYKMNLDKLMRVNAELRVIFRQRIGMGYDEFRALPEPKDDENYYRWSVIYKIWRKK